MTNPQRCRDLCCYSASPRFVWHIRWALLGIMLTISHARESDRRLWQGYLSILTSLIKQWNVRPMLALRCSRNIDMQLRTTTGIAIPLSTLHSPFSIPNTSHHIASYGPLKLSLPYAFAIPSYLTPPIPSISQDSHNPTFPPKVFRSLSLPRSYQDSTPSSPPQKPLVSTHPPIHPPKARTKRNFRDLNSTSQILNVHDHLWHIPLLQLLIAITSPAHACKFSSSAISAIAWGDFIMGIRVSLWDSRLGTYESGLSSRYHVSIVRFRVMSWWKDWLSKLGCAILVIAGVISIIMACIWYVSHVKKVLIP